MKDPHHKRERAKYEHPIPSREMIIAHMTALGEPIAFKRLAKELNLDAPRERDALTLRMRAMVRDGQLIVDRRNSFALATKLELFAGKVSAHRDGFGFVMCEIERDDIFLSSRQMRAVFHGDKVLVRISGRDRRGRDEGEIIEVLERGTEQLVGRIYFVNKVPLLEALNRRIGHEIHIEGPHDLIKDGQIAVAKIKEQPSLHGLASVEILAILGEHLTPDLEVEVALRNNDIPFVFSDDVVAEVDSLPIEVAPRSKANRKDLRDLDFVTIDGEDARDFDDAVYCEAGPEGGYRLLVAIADVANYVLPDSALNDEAFSRGTSVYFPQYVVPMLPEKLSNGLCSLNPLVDRLVMVCEMNISSTGKVLDYLFFEAVIHSKGRLTYTQVAQWLEQGHAPAHWDNLANLEQLALLLMKGRKKRGALDFDTREVKFIFDENSRISGVGAIQRNFAHKLIEECMLCTNVVTARFLAASKLPALYRVHDRPDTEKVEYLREFLASFGVILGGGLLPSPLDYQHAIDQLRDRPSGQILQVALLRSMQQAVYQTENKGHFGLAYTHYAHFTSPIRRFPDLLVHRLIKSVIHSNRECNEVQRFGNPRKVEFYPYELEAVVTQGVHLSFAERRADEAVYEVLERIKCEYISGHIGEEFAGTISAVTKFGFFVQITELFVEGLVHVSALSGDYFRFEQSIQCLVGERTRKAYGLGDVVTVQVAKVDVDERKVDLELLTHVATKRQPNPPAPSGSKKGKKPGRNGKANKRAGGRSSTKKRDPK